MLRSALLSVARLSLAQLRLLCSALLLIARHCFDALLTRTRAFGSVEPANYRGNDAAPTPPCRRRAPKNAVRIKKSFCASPAGSEFRLS